MQAQNSVRTDNFVSMVNTLLRTDAGVRAKLQEYKHVLVDEVQDNDASQYNFVRHLARDDSHIFFVGDPNQSIFEFRGADVRRNPCCLPSVISIGPLSF
jgi:ATP-dependent exoDNAse (exonuclease V) beta subunit